MRPCLKRGEEEEEEGGGREAGGTEEKCRSKILKNAGVAHTENGILAYICLFNQGYVFWVLKPESMPIFKEKLCAKRF